MLLELTVAGTAALAYLTRDFGATPFDPIFDKVAGETGVPANLLRAIARKETGTSNSLPPSKNANGSFDYGLMRINSATAARYGYDESQLTDPTTNVRAAARLLVETKRSLGDRFTAHTWAAAYNVGPDLQPAEVGRRYAADVVYNWTMYDLARLGA